MEYREIRFAGTPQGWALNQRTSWERSVPGGLRGMRVEVVQLGAHVIKLQAQTEFGAM